jgi:hypothetical protein
LPTKSWYLISDFWFGRSFFRIENISIESLIILYLVTVILCFGCVIRLLCEQFKNDRENNMSKRYFKSKSGLLSSAQRPGLGAGVELEIRPPTTADD